MDTTNNYTDKLEQIVQERKEAWRELSNWVIVHENSLPQEFVSRWQEVERAEAKIELIVEECREQNRKDFERKIRNLF